MTRGEGADSVHLRLFPEIPADWENKELASKIARLREVRRVATGALETARAQKIIGSSLQASPRLAVSDESLFQELQGIDLAELFITSDVVIEKGTLADGVVRLDDVDGVAVQVELASGNKCQRCWKILPDVGQDPDLKDTCSRCADAVRRWDEVAQSGAA